jgi:hypothetical protein
MSNPNQRCRRTLLWAILIASLVLLPLAFVAYQFASPFFTHQSDPAAASSAADVAELTSVPPPPEASGFRVASLLGSGESGAALGR